MLLRRAWSAGENGMGSEIRWPRGAAAWFVVGLVSVAGIPSLGEDAPKRVHPRPELLRPALREIATSLMRDDVVAALAAVERLEEANPQLFIEDNEHFGPTAKNLSQALHKVLDGTKGYLHRGDAEEAFNEFVWVQRTCRSCHQKGRELGLLPAEGPLWSPEGNHAESTQTPSTTP
jgi:hypothetical protein